MRRPSGAVVHSYTLSTSKWRFKKHLQQHESQNWKYCHFFNNNKFCRFEEIGCMYEHEVAPSCGNQSNCRVNLCQYRHSLTSNGCDFNTKSISDVKYPQRNHHNLAENSENEMGPIYKCNECQF